MSREEKITTIKYHSLVPATYYVIVNVIVCICAFPTNVFYENLMFVIEGERNTQKINAPRKNYCIIESLL